MGIVDLVTVRQVAQLLREIYDDGCRRCAEDLQQFAGPLNDWVDELLQRTLPDNWRELLRDYLAEQEPKGYRIEPENLPPLEDWIHDWAEYRGLLPTTGEVAEQVATGQLAQSGERGGAPSEPQVGKPESAKPDPIVRATPAPATSTESQFFDQKLAEAQDRLDRTQQLLEALGNRLDAAMLDEEVEVETDVDQIEEQIWHYHDALESARDAWLRGNLSGEANTRLLGLATPASFGLPLFTDDQQARRAQQQELEIGRRLHQRNVTMDRIHLGAVAVDWTVTGAGIVLGVGILASIGRKGGRWAVVKTLAGVGAGYLADRAAEAGLRAAGASEQTIRGARLAAAVVGFILLRRRLRAFDAKSKSPSPETQPGTLPSRPKGRLLPPGEAKRKVGIAFNKARESAYPHNEIPIAKPGGGRPNYLDSYDDVKGEIVFRRHTQFSEIQSTTAKAYFREFVQKYPPGSTIANVPSAGELAGQTLKGRMIFEVPPQWKSIPKLVLDEAKRLNILIRDSNGRIYNAD